MRTPPAGPITHGSCTAAQASVRTRVIHDGGWYSSYSQPFVRRQTIYPHAPTHGRGRTLDGEIESNAPHHSPTIERVPFACFFTGRTGTFIGIDMGTRREPFNSTPMAANHVDSGPPHVRPTGRVCTYTKTKKKVTPKKCLPLAFLIRHAPAGHSRRDGRRQAHRGDAASHALGRNCMSEGRAELDQRRHAYRGDAALNTACALEETR